MIKNTFAFRILLLLHFSVIILAPLSGDEIRKGWSFYKPEIGEPSIDEIRALDDASWTAVYPLVPFKTKKMGPILWLRLSLPEREYPDPILKIGSVDQMFSLFLDETKLYEYGTRTDYLSSFSRHQIRLPSDYSGKTLYFEVYSAIEMIGIGNGQIEIGNSGDIAKKILKTDLDQIIMGTLYCVLALFSFILFFIRKKEQNFLSFAILVLSTGGISIARTDIMQMIFGNHHALFGRMEIYSQYLLTVGLNLFVHDILKSRKKGPVRAFGIALTLFALSVILISTVYPNILQIMFPFFKTIILANIILCLLLCIVSAFRKNAEALVFVFGFAVSSLFSSYDLLQEMHILPQTHFVTPWGILFLTGSLAAIVLNRILQVYANLQSYSRQLEAKNALVLETNAKMEILNYEIEATQKEVILRLSEVAEARSKETGNHVRRVTEYALLLAEKFGLSQKELNLIKLAAPMHDIGKLGIPDSILMKPGKLTSEEFTVIQSHTLVGYEMLRKSERDIFVAAALIAHQHHEKINGLGYPQGLNGDKIHIFGRITAVADVFDSLASDRCYKKAWPMDQVLAHMREESGSHFDPGIIEVLFDNIDAILKIRDTFLDEFTT